MTTETLEFDEQGNPRRVHVNGYGEYIRPYDADKDAWMLMQLDPLDFEAVRTGRQMEALIAEVNALRAQNFKLERELRFYRNPHR